MKKMCDLFFALWYFVISILTPPSGLKTSNFFLPNTILLELGTVPNAVYNSNNCSWTNHNLSLTTVPIVVELNLTTSVPISIELQLKYGSNRCVFWISFGNKVVVCSSLHPQNSMQCFIIWYWFHLRVLGCSRNCKWFRVCHMLIKGAGIYY